MEDWRRRKCEKSSSFSAEDDDSRSTSISKWSGGAEDDLRSSSVIRSMSTRF